MPNLRPSYTGYKTRGLTVVPSYHRSSLSYSSPRYHGLEPRSSGFGLASHPVMARARSLFLSLLTGTLLTYSPFTFNPGFPIQQVASLAESLPSHSWEYGATSQALLELYNPLLSVFGPTPFPVQASQKDQVKALSYAASKITLGQYKNALADGGGAVGDPASLGVSAVMLGKTDPSFGKAADATVDYLLNFAPRYYNGAISQRVSTPELWYVLGVFTVYDRF